MSLAFDRSEKTVILVTDVDNSRHDDEYPDITTRDSSFLLSALEAERYFSSDTERKCTATKYARENGVSLNSEYACVWWLRSSYQINKWSGKIDATGAVLRNGSISTSVNFEIPIARDETGHIGIRPAMWVDLAVIDAIVEKDQIRQTGEELRIKGNTVSFGSYEQDNDLENGLEPIEWIVLDVQPGKSLLISKYGLDCQPYNTKKHDITWEWCSLRSWLNGAFLSKAFSAEEQKTILKTSVDNCESTGNSAENKVGGNSTSDRVFVLSHLEKAKYFALNEESICNATEFAKAQGAYTDSNENGWWWLRIIGSPRYFAPTVNSDGALGYPSNVNRGDVTVRPALWIDWNSDYFSDY